MTDLQKILRMRKPKGRNVGTAMLLNLVNDYERTGQPHEPLFTQEKLAQMVESFTSDYDLAVYSNYADIVTGIEQLFDYVEGSFQKVMHGFFRINRVLTKQTVKVKLQGVLSDYTFDAEKLAEDILNASVLLFKSDDDFDYVGTAYRELLIPGICEMLAFDCFIALLAGVTEVEALTHIRSRMPTVAEAVEMLNRDLRFELPPPLPGLFQKIDIVALHPERVRFDALARELANVNISRCPQLKKLKPLMLSLISGGNNGA